MPQPPHQPSPCPRARPRRGRDTRLALLLLLPLSAGAPAPAWASPPSPLAAAAQGARTAEHWTAAQGVPGRVTALLQSADGYLWVGTRRGLVRFDGQRFSPVPASDGATELNVRALLADPDGTLYVASDRGLGRLRQGRFTRLEAGERPVHALARGPDGALWAATETGLSRLSGDVLEPVAGGTGPLEALTVDATGRLLAGGPSGLWVHAGGRLVQPPAAEGGTATRVLALLTDRRGRTWVGTEAGLRRADAAGVAAGRPFGAGLSSPLVVALCEDAEGHLWVATSAGGLQHLSDDGASAAPPEEGWPSRLSTALLADQGGSLWSGSGSGLDRLRPRLLAPVPRTAGLPAEVVWSVYLDPTDDSLWIGLDGAGADHLVDGRLGPSDPPVAPAGSTVSATLRTRDGALWSSLGAGGVLRRQGGRSEAVRSADGRPYVRVRGLFQGADESVWLGTEEGLERFEEGRATRVPVSHGWPFRVITEDAAGDLWAGGLGLVRLRAPDYREDTPPELAGQLDLVAILPDGPDLWLASYTRGLLLWHDQRLTDLSELDPRLRGRAVAVLADDRDGLWVAMEGSLVRAQRAELLAAAEGRRPPLRLLAFDERDGLPSTDFTSAGQTSAARTRDGRLWFGTVAGLAVVDPALIERLPPPSPPVVERVFVAGAELPPQAGPVRLGGGSASLELQFTSPTLAAPHRLQFRHRLAGREAAWQATGPLRSAAYRDLPAGDYRLEVEVSRDGADWIAMAAPVALEIRPGLLERPSVQALLLLLGAALLVAAVTAVQRLLGRRLRARAEELERVVEERTRELAASRDLLEVRVEERTAQLQRELAERERLEHQLTEAQKLDSIGRLAGGVAHDLNNLLTVVLGCATTAQLPDATPAEVKEDLEEIKKAGDRAAALTRQLLAFARRQILASKRLDLNEVVAGVGTLLRRVIGAHLELVTATAPAPCPVLADPGQLEQVLVNLAVNARDAMPAGGTLRLETALVRLEDDAGGAHPGVAAGAWVRLTVSDTGTGLSPEAARHLFEPFFTTKEKGKGTGLGLATCYGIVKQMGGHIWLEGRPGGGTTVEILLPRAEGTLEHPGAPEAGRAEQRQGGGEQVLVAEDEPQVQALVARVLAERGYQVSTAGDGEAALRLREEAGRPFDLLLTDVIMPRMGGVELAARLVERDPGQAVLFMSGYVDRSASAQGALPEGRPVLLKPFSPSSLAAKVREVLDARARPPGPAGGGVAPGAPRA